MWRASRAVTRAIPGNGDSCVISAWHCPSTLRLLVRHESKATETAGQGSKSESAPPPPPRSGGGWFWKFFGLTVVGAGGVVGYAWYDPSFRTTLEGTVPYSKEVLDYAFQYLPPAEAGKESSAGKKHDSLSSTHTQSSAKVPTAQPAIQAPAATSSTPAAIVSGQKDEQKNITTKQNAAEQKRQEKERAEKAVKESEQKEISENKELELLLELVRDEAHGSVAQAVHALTAAAEAMRSHSKQVKQAMESSSSETQWTAASDSHQSRTDAVQKSDAAKLKAKKSLDKLRTVISDGKATKSTKKNKALSLSETELNKLNSTLTAAQTELSKAESEAKVMTDYRDLVKKGKEQFQKELESLKPDVKPGEKKGKLSNEELNSLITHAHRRIEQLQRQLAELQSMEPQRVERALERQREEDESHATELVQLERERMQSELSTLLQNWEAEGRVESERELRAQLTRQAAAHSDHIIEVLRVQQKEIESRYQRKTAQRLQEEKEVFDQQTRGSVSKLRGIEEAVEARAEMEKRGQKAQELWLACQTLASALSRDDISSSSNGLRSVTTELATVREAGSGNPYVTSILTSLPEVVSERGVWSENDLAERFHKVAKIGRRVAMIDEAGGTLFRYFLSYVQSMFVLHGSRPIGRDSLVTPADLSTFELLDNATACMERGDLEQAVRFVNQLHGESRKVASDWLKEARLLLEARQAAEALLSFATATGLSSLF